MDEQFFKLRHTVERDEDGRIEADERFYLNTEPYADALSELLHCFAFGVSFWGKNRAIRKERGGYLSFNYFFEGDAEIRGEGRRFIARTGDLLVAQFSQSFTVRTGPSGQVRKLCLLLSRTPLQNAICRQLFPEDLRLVHLEHPERIRTILDRIALAVKTPMPEQRDTVARAIFDFLLELSRLRTREHAPKLPEAALKLLTDAPEERISREALAAACGVGIRTLTRRFHQEFGCPPGEYVLRLRLERAARLLVISDESIKGIASECGFNSPMFFSRAFKKRYGTSPGTFRRSGGVPA